MKSLNIKNILETADQLLLIDNIELDADEKDFVYKQILYFQHYLHIYMQPLLQYGAYYQFSLQTAPIVTFSIYLNHNNEIIEYRWLGNIKKDNNSLLTLFKEIAALKGISLNPLMNPEVIRYHLTQINAITHRKYKIVPHYFIHNDLLPQVSIVPTGDRKQQRKTGKYWIQFNLTETDNNDSINELIESLPLTTLTIYQHSLRHMLNAIEGFKIVGNGYIPMYFNLRTVYKESISEKQLLFEMLQFDDTTIDERLSENYYPLYHNHDYVMSIIEERLSCYKNDKQQKEASETLNKVMMYSMIFNSRYR